MSSFWSAWIIVLTVISFVLIVWLLFSNRKITVDENRRTTGHVYDGIEEYDNPLPSWWIKMFVISIVFGVGYLIAYPGLGNFPGLLNWTSVGQWEAEVERADQANAELYQSFMQKDVVALADDDKAMRIGKRLFANNCSVCHGVNAEGSYGFPNLTDSDWLYGGQPEQIRQSIAAGRNGMMPGWEAMLGEQGLAEMTQYVLSLSESENPATDDTGNGAKQQFAQLCASCHGADGTGNPMLGAPDLSDDTWLYGGDPGRIKHSIAKGRSGKMPAHKDMLSADKIHLLTAYVYQLSQNSPQTASR